MKQFAASRIFVALLFSALLHAATFGTRVPVAGGPLDLVLDERRGRLYLVDFNTNAVQVYAIQGRRFLPSIPVGNQPVSGALSPDGKFLYVTNFGASTLSVINLDQNAIVRTIALPARPEGAAVGADGKVVVTTLGTGTAANPLDTLIVVNPDARDSEQLSSVLLPPPAPAAPPTAQQQQQAGQRPFQAFRGRLLATADGQRMVGVNGGTNTTTVFVYEVASQKVLRARTVPGLSSTLSISADGSRFMAGILLFDTATLNVLAQQSANNAPFPVTGNITAASGGSVFSPDGATLYGAFNLAPTVLPQPRPNSSTLLISNPRNLGIRLGIQLPESVLGKMVVSSDGSNVFALSDSGLLLLPVGTLNTLPILQPETTSVRLSMNQCERVASSRTIAINNTGRGALRFTVTPVAANAGLIAQPDAGGGLRLAMNPAVTRRLGSTMTTVSLQSAEAINIPPPIRVYQNWQNAETKTPIFPIEVGINDAEGLADVVVDNLRQHVYIANSGKNQVEVFDIRQQALRNPIEVGQFPRSMAFGTDNRTLFVANSGGEWISMVDLDQGREYDRIRFPPVPFFAAAGAVTPRAIAQGIFGLQVFASTAANAAGQLWSTSGKDAILRAQSNAIGAATIAAPVSMVSTPGNELIMLLSGNGIAYLYDSLADDYVLASRVMSTPINSYYGPVAAGPEGRYFLANRAILNSALVPVGGFAGGTNAQAPGGAQQPGVQLPPGFRLPPGVQLPPGFPGGGGQQPPDSQQQVPPQPGGGGGQAQVTPGLRNVPAVVAVNATTYARLSTPQQANANAQPTGDPQPLIELVDINTEQVRGSVPVSEGALTNVFGNGRANVSGRLMAVDNRAQNAFVVTASGLSVVPLAVGRPADSIRVNPRAVVNGATFASAISPGGLISIFGQNLADGATAGVLPLPTTLGGTCVTFNDVAVPLLMTSPGQINAQVPPNLRAGSYVVVVRSPQNALGSNGVPVVIAASAPGIFAKTDTSEAALFHAADMRPVTADNPASRDERLVLFATGLPAATGVNLQPGAPAPASPLATTQRARVFIGDPRIRESEMIVEWSGFTPGFVGLNQINIRVPGDRVRGERLPVRVQVGAVSSPSTAPVVPVTYVR